MKRGPKGDVGLPGEKGEKGDSGHKGSKGISGKKVIISDVEMHLFVALFALRSG